jgi:hypothetical protein
VTPSPVFLRRRYASPTSIISAANGTYELQNFGVLKKVKDLSPDYLNIRQCYSGRSPSYIGSDYMALNA